jgi:hypothetical protein|tara:strand:- start:5713 stop:5940 length:228 start_codon:yes stop_codon:yes gene_type:complete
MKLNYTRLQELNREALVDNERGQLSSYYLIQMGVEKFLENDTLTNQHTKLLIEVGVLEITEEDQKPIVSPHNFGG